MNCPRKYQNDSKMDAFHSRKKADNQGDCLPARSARCRVHPKSENSKERNISEPSNQWKKAARVVTAEKDFPSSTAKGDCFEGGKQETMPLFQFTSYLTPVFSLVPPVAMETDFSDSRELSDVRALLKSFADSRHAQSRVLPCLATTKSGEKFLQNQTTLTRGEEALNWGRRRNGLPAEFRNQAVSIEALKPVETVVSRNGPHASGKRPEKPSERVSMRSLKSNNTNSLMRGKTQSRDSKCARTANTNGPDMALGPWSNTDDDGPLRSGPLAGVEPRSVQPRDFLYLPHHGL